MRRDINFFSVYRAPADGEFSNKFNIIALSILAGSIIIVLGIFSYLKIADLTTISANNAGISYLQSPTVAKAEKILGTTRSKLAALNSYEQAAERVSYGFASLPKLDSSLLTEIAKTEPKDLNIQSFTYLNGAVTLTCTSSQSNSAAVFVHALQKTKKFSNVNYSGVTSAVAGSKSTYSFTVLITLMGESSK